jgi:signal peptidase I
MAKKQFQDYGREWLDTLVVAISVAMAFRAYFFEPFNIPTGSMQETLWGNHAVEKVEKSSWDKWPLSYLKWAWSGAKYVECTSDMAGMVTVRGRNDGYADVRVGRSNKSWKLPTEVASRLSGKFVEKGETFWKGDVIKGDFIFVNRWRWNFFKPKTGEVMIFSTTGIEGLPKGIHYIKRMKAAPGETYVLEHPPRDRYGEEINSLPKVVTMGKDEYFACGDNFNNSYDSRYWGTVPGRNLIGVGSVVFWPFSGWRIIR